MPHNFLKITVVTFASSAALLMALTFVDENAFAQESSPSEVKESSLKETVHEAGLGLKKGLRNAADKGCELVKGKVQCAGQKVRHKVRNTTDELKHKIDDNK